MISCPSWAGYLRKTTDKKKRGVSLSAGETPPFNIASHRQHFGPLFLGYRDAKLHVTTPIVVTNADEFTIKTVAEGAVVPGAALLKLEANK